eukprot:1598027-Pyramimonas_sp.AAC.1
MRSRKGGDSELGPGGARGELGPGGVQGVTRPGGVKGETRPGGVKGERGHAAAAPLLGPRGGVRGCRGSMAGRAAAGGDCCPTVSARRRARAKSATDGHSATPHSCSD